MPSTVPAVLTATGSALSRNADKAGYPMPDGVNNTASASARSTTQ